ncbi:unnamed protein product [Rodentolepis nana]|uniref:VWFA domain-containing protein n=1 Tax=Rodentolepis nana TaxID=102285 RepID=A0A0R3SZU0_RODNA|nr:unnamed protein product [Rodentolepis nana]
MTNVHMPVREWLSENGIKAKNLELFAYLVDCKFPHVSSNKCDYKVVINCIIIIRMAFFTFSTNILPFRRDLTLVTPETLGSAKDWLNALTCGGSTNTRLALEYALSDILTEEVYLVTDGRPDQPTDVLLAQFGPSKIPIHTVSFHCYDTKANEFLAGLSKATCGRFNCFDREGTTIPVYESEDIRLLREELLIGKASLEMIRELYHQCYSKQKGRTDIVKPTSAKDNITKVEDVLISPLKMRKKKIGINHPKKEAISLVNKDEKGLTNKKPVEDLIAVDKFNGIIYFLFNSSKGPVKSIEIWLSKYGLRTKKLNPYHLVKPFILRLPAIYRRNLHEETFAQQLFAKMHSVISASFDAELFINHCSKLRDSISTIER